MFSEEGDGMMYTSIGPGVHTFLYLDTVGRVDFCSGCCLILAFTSADQALLTSSSARQLCSYRQRGSHGVTWLPRSWFLSFGTESLRDICYIQIVPLCVLVWMSRLWLEQHASYVCMGTKYLTILKYWPKREWNYFTIASNHNVIVCPAHKLHLIIQQILESLGGWDKCIDLNSKLNIYFLASSWASEPSFLTTYSTWSQWQVATTFFWHFPAVHSIFVQ